MPEKNAISNLYTMAISGSAFLIVSLTAFIVNRFNKTRDEDKTLNEKVIIELKAIIKEQNEAFKKDLGEAFNRIRDLENIQNVMKTEHDINHRRGDNNGKWS